MKFTELPQKIESHLTSHLRDYETPEFSIEETEFRGFPAYEIVVEGVEKTITIVNGDYGGSGVFYGQSGFETNRVSDGQRAVQMLIDSHLEKDD